MQSLDQSKPSEGSSPFLSDPIYFAFAFSKFTLRTAYILNLLKVFILSIKESMLATKQVISFAKLINLISESSMLIPWILEFSIMLIHYSH